MLRVLLLLALLHTTAFIATLLAAKYSVWLVDEDGRPLRPQVPTPPASGQAPGVQHPPYQKPPSIVA